MATPQKMSAQWNSETRQRLLEAGVRLFAEHGYRGVSVRDLCTEASVNIAAVTYHFGGKQGLYQAIFEATLDADEPRFQESMRYIELTLASTRGNREQLAVAIHCFVNGLLAPLTASDHMRWFGVLVIRELAFPSTEFNLIYQRRARPAQHVFAKIIAEATGEPAGSDRVRIQTHALVGMVYHFGLSRSILWRTMDWRVYTPERVALIGDVVAKTICSALSLPVLRGASSAGEA